MHIQKEIPLRNPTRLFAWLSLLIVVGLLVACAPSPPPSMPRSVETDIPDSMAGTFASPLPTHTVPEETSDAVYKRAVNFAVDTPLSQVFQIEVQRADGNLERYRFPSSAVPRIDTDAYRQFRQQWIHLADGDQVIYEGPAEK